MDEFLQAFGITQTAGQAGSGETGTQTGETGQAGTTQDPPPAGEAGATGSQAGAGEAGQAATGGENQQQQQQTGGQATPPIDKAQQAFAQQRIEIKKYQELLKNIGGVLGVQNSNDPEALINALNEKVINAQAKQQNVPPELLMTVEKLKAENEAAQMERLQRAAYVGFQSVKDQFKLDDKALSEYADALKAAGINPFATPIDLVADYKIRYYDKLVADAIERGKKEEAERAAKAAAHSTTPGNKSGQNGGEAGKINTVADLNNFFNSKN